MTFRIFLDWTKQMKVIKPTVRGSTDDRRMKLYERMKNTIFEDSVEVVPISNFVEGTNKTESMKNIVLFDKMIFKCKSKVIETYCMLGVELGNLKFCYYADFCETCSSSVDKYVVLGCKSCAHIASNAAGLKEFVKYCENSLSRSSKSYINFLIKVGKLCKQYPRFSRVTITLDELNRNMSWIPIYMSKDASFWKQNIGKTLI